MLAAKNVLPNMFGCNPSDLKQESRFQNRLKLSIKPSLRAVQVD